MSRDIVPELVHPLLRLGHKCGSDMRDIVSTFGPVEPHHDVMNNLELVS